MRPELKRFAGSLLLLFGASCGGDFPGPQQTVSVGGSGDIVALAADGERLVAVEAGYGLHVFDVTDPGAAFLLGSVAAPLEDSVALHGDVAAALDSDRCPRVFDTRDAPIEVARIASGIRCEATSLAFVGDLLYVAYSEVIGGVNGINAYDLSDPAAPMFVSSFRSSGIDGVECLAVGGQGDKIAALCSDTSNQVVVFDAAAPWSLNPGYGTGHVSNGVRFAASDRFAAYTDPFGVQVVDLSGPRPTLGGTIEHSPLDASVAIDGSFLAVGVEADGHVGFFDLETLPELTLIEEVAAPRVLSVALGPNGAYAGGEGEVYVFVRPGS